MSSNHSAVLYFDKTENRLVYNREVPISADIFRDIPRARPHAITLPRADVFHLIERIHAILDGKMSDEYIRTCFPVPGTSDQTTETGSDCASVVTMFEYAEGLRVILGDLSNWLQLRHERRPAVSLGSEESGPFPVQLVRIYSEAAGALDPLGHGVQSAQHPTERRDRGAHTEPMSEQTATCYAVGVYAFVMAICIILEWLMGLVDRWQT